MAPERRNFLSFIIEIFKGIGEFFQTLV